MNSRTGRVERVYIDLEAVYPNPDDTSEEYSFEELIARQRGWLNLNWNPDPPVESVNGSEELEQTVEKSEDLENREASKPVSQETDFAEDHQSMLDSVSDTRVNTQDSTIEVRPSRAKKMKVREVKAEAQTSTIAPFR